MDEDAAGGSLATPPRTPPRSPIRARGASSVGGLGVSPRSSTVSAKMSECWDHIRAEEGPEPVATENLPSYVLHSATLIVMTAARDLECIWDELGYDFAARKRYTDSLLEAVSAACEARVRDERRLREDVLDTMRNLKAEVLELCESIGRPIPPERQNDEFFLEGASPEDRATLQGQLAVLEVKMEILSKEAGERRASMQAVYDEIMAMRLSMDPEAPPEPGVPGADVSDAAAAALASRRAAVEAECDEREAAMVELVQQCQRLFRQLRLEPEQQFDQQVMGSLCPFSEVPKLRCRDWSMTCVGLRKSSLERLRDRVEQLGEEVVLRTEQAARQRKQIEDLWALLDTPLKEREAFNASISGISFKDMERLERQLEALRGHKARRLHDLIKAARREIEALLAARGATAEEVFKEGADALSAPEREWCEELLSQHERCLHVLSASKASVEELLKMIAARERLVAERTEYEVAYEKVDYLARGTGLAEQLRRLEAMKVRVKQRLPAMTKSVRKELLEWERVEGVPLRYKGRRYLDHMEETERAWENRRKDAKAARKNLPPEVPSPLNSPSASASAARLGKGFGAIGAAPPFTLGERKGSGLSRKSSAGELHSSGNSVAAASTSSGAGAGLKKARDDGAVACATSGASAVSLASAIAAASLSASTAGRRAEKPLPREPFGPPAPPLPDRRNPLLPHDNSIVGSSPNGSRPLPPPPLPARPASVKTPLPRQAADDRGARQAAGRDVLRPERAERTVAASDAARRLSGGLEEEEVNMRAIF